jgi:hypothetical protein
MTLHTECAAWGDACRRAKKGVSSNLLKRIPPFTTCQKREAHRNAAAIEENAYSLPSFE